MIKTSTFNGAMASAAALVALGKVALPKPGTVISELVRLSQPGSVFDGSAQVTDSTNPVTPVIGSGGNIDSYAFQVEAITTGTLENPTKHSLELDGFVKDISKVVREHISFAKNTVRPLVTDYAEALTNYLKTTKPKEAGQAAVIKTLRIPAILKDESFLDSLVAYKDKSIFTPDASLRLGTKQLDELNEFIFIGHDRSDKLIVEWLSHLPESFLSNVWNCFFTESAVATENGGNIAIRYEDINAMNAFDKADNMLAILLFARKCLSSTQESSLSLTQYNNICSQYIEYASTSLIDALAKINLGIRTKTLIVDKDQYNLKVSVNGEVYGPWLESGGTPEVILGALITTGSSSLAAVIDERRKEYLNQWNSYCMFFHTREVNNSFTYAKNFIESSFVASLQNLTPSELEIVANRPKHNELIVANMRLYIDSLTPSDITDAYSVALFLVAKTRFHYTSAYQILGDIVKTSQYNPNVDVREAALIAAINYVSDYVADQITLS